MKNFNILGVHRKIRVLERGFTINQYIGGNSLKRGVWTVCRFGGYRHCGSDVFSLPRNLNVILK